MPMYSAGTASAPVSPTLRDTMEAADKGGFDFPGTSSSTQPGLVVTPAGDALGASASDTNLPATGINSVPASSGPEHFKSTDFAAPRHHHHHHRAPAALPYGNRSHDAPAYSLGGAHAYPPSAAYGQYAPAPGTRRAGQRQVQGLGRAMPTWQEMQLHKQLKAERAARALENGGHRHHHKSGATTPRNASMTNLAAVPPPASVNGDIHQAVAEMQQAMLHLTSLLPEGYAGTMTPYTLTPAASRQVTRTGTAEPSMNGDAHMNENGYGNGKENNLKPTTSHSSGSSCSSDDEEEEEEKPNPLARFRHWIREPAAEFLGTALLITFGNGVNNQFFLSRDPDISDLVRGTYTSISWCWGIGVMTGVYVSGGISGGHINPVVTVSLAIFRQFPWRKVLPFILAQILGAMTASAFISLLYQEATDIFEGGAGIRTVTGVTSTANLYTTFPLAYLSVSNGFFQEFFDTAVLMIVILAIGDSNNTPPPDGLNPLILCFLIFGIGAALGSQTAYAINPARDLGPRLMLWCRGYGTELWTANSAYWITTPIAATFVGGLAGCLVYDVFIYTGAESPLNQKWEWRWSKKNKGLVNEGPAPGTENQMNEKLPAGGDRARHGIAV